jgi:hypothetical protein
MFHKYLTLKTKERGYPIMLIPTYKVVQCHEQDDAPVNGYMEANAWVNELMYQSFFVMQ